MATRRPRRLRLNRYGLPISVLHWQGDGPTVFCLHGWLDQAANFEWAAQIIRQKANVYAIDFRGHGHSAHMPDGSYHFFDYLLDLDTLYRELNVDKAYLLGHSMGGMVASYWAASFPDRVPGMLSLEGIGPPDYDMTLMTTYVQQWLKGRNKRVEEDRTYKPITLEDAAGRLQKAVKTLPRDRALHLARQGTKKVDGGVLWRFDRRHKERTPYRFFLPIAQALWDNLKTPLIYVEGGASSWQGLKDKDERVAALKPEKIVTIPHVGHHLPVEAPVEVAEITLDALARWEG